MVNDGAFIRFGTLQFTDLNSETEVSITHGTKQLSAIINPEEIKLLIKYLKDALHDD